jgi:hypothetical protein
MRVLVGIGALLASVGAAASALAQDAAVPPHILLEQMTRPDAAPPPSASTLDVRDAPNPPPVDTLSDAIRFTVVVGDPRCFPGDELMDPRPLPGRLRRPR